MGLQTHLDAQITRLTNLQQLLEQEQSMLSAGTIDGAELERIAQAKTALQQEIEAAEQQRRTAQQKLGFATDSKGARKAADQAGCLDTWETLLQAAERVAKMNQLNGELIQHRLHHNQHMLNILRDASGGGQLYGSDGNQPTRPQRINSKA
ncbi:flagellar protein FlgN [Pseudidiomarina aestuarii]|uniref:Flagellar protein FlgN n=1 Tax=Pseudidiomarina aestuarii TaxID=624146 RepID=A0A7Z6ZVI9_9GAMM|nr:flagellar protein FlgN [Pseudidiomarina aestuarii]RUO42169.1 flagellar protein FlgN [Pseudidiomarina aestuarii]